MSKQYVKINQQTLECSICLDTFRKPKALGCQHSFCEECLENTARSNRRMIKCPLCHRTFVLPEEGVKGLPNNFLIVSLLDEASGAKKDESAVERSVAEAGSDRIRLACTLCKDNEAVAQCLDCYKLLCITCKDTHTTNQGTSNHGIATLEDVKAGKIQPRSATAKKVKECEIHKGNVPEKFCTLCGKLVCEVCIETGDHPVPEHLLILAKDAPRYCQNSLNTLMPKASKIARKFQNAANQIEADQKIMNQEMELVKLQIQNDAQAIIAKIEKEKLALLSEVDRLHHEKIEKGNEVKNEIEMEGNRVTKVYQSAKKAVYKNAGGILENYGTLLTSLQNLKEDPEMIDPSYTRPLAYSTVSSMTQNLLGKVLDTTLLQLDPLLEIRTVNIPGKREEKRLQFAYGLAVCPNGDLIVTDRDDALAYRLSCNGHLKCIFNSSQRKKDGDLREPRDVAVATNGNIFIVDHSEYVKVYNPEGKFVKRFTTLQADENPHTKSKLRCVRIIHHQGHEILLVADFQRKLLTIHNIDGTLTKTIHLMLNPSYMAVNPSNKQILITDYWKGRLESINLDGQMDFLIDTIVDGQNLRASGVCWGSSNDFYIALHPAVLSYRDHGGVCSIHQYTSDGKHLSCMANGLNNPVHMAFAQDGNLVVTNRVSVSWYRLSTK